MNLEDYDETKGEEEGGLSLSGLSLPDQYILSRLQRVTAEIGEMIDRYDLGGAANLLYDFIWSEYCDWYIEMAKPPLREGGAARRRTQQVLVKVFRQILVLLHPYMPFITERSAGSPRGREYHGGPLAGTGARFMSPEAEKMGLLMEVTRAIRNLRAENQVEPGRRIDAILLASPGAKKVLEENRLYLEVLAGLGQLAIQPEGSAKPAQAVTAVVSGVEVYLPLAGLVDLEKEKERLEKELAGLAEEKSRLEQKLANTQFLAKAPEAVVAKEKQKLAAVEEKYAKVSARLAALKS